MINKYHPYLIIANRVRCGWKIGTGRRRTIDYGSKGIDPPMRNRSNANIICVVLDSGPQFIIYFAIPIGIGSYNINELSQSGHIRLAL